MNCSKELENLKEERTDRKELENQTKKERTSRKRLENLNRSKGTGESEKEEETFREGFDYESVEKEANRSERSRPRNKKEDHNFRNATRESDKEQIVGKGLENLRNKREPVEMEKRTEAEAKCAKSRRECVKEERVDRNRHQRTGTVRKGQRKLRTRSERLEMD